ncbi:MAG: hypothetical protein HQM11_14165 [SAR324 cluster bacterium]|nr:hypothetical protein [SAR324 cluster bacterium]
MIRTSFMQLSLIIVLVLSVVSSANALELKLRAREHFDTVNVRFTEQDIDKTWSGIGPTINLWLEEAYQYSFGFAFGIIFIDNPALIEIPQIDEKMELWKQGVEVKYYAIPKAGGIFFRLGVSSNTLKTKGSWGELQGMGAYAGIGWEFQFSKIGLAFEQAKRQVNLENSIEIVTTSPSIGVHLYSYF